jgi:mono/diheme cytochrome c family protein
MKKVWIGFALCALFLVGSLLFVYSGVYNVAATESHTAPVFWMLSTMTERSIEAHASGITPPELSDENTLNVGLEHYNAMCITCHGAPGMAPAELASGLYPPPPNLAAGSTEMTSSELYWVIKNGIKMTGMPSFGPTHSDDQIWAMVSAVENLPQWSPEEYEQRVKSLGLDLPPSDHEHESTGHDRGEHEHGSTEEPAGTEAANHDHESEDRETSIGEGEGRDGGSDATHSHLKDRDSTMVWRYCTAPGLRKVTV